MTRRPDPHDLADEPILDALQGELDPAAEAGLRARLASEPELAAAQDAWVRLARAERAAFEPTSQSEAAEADAGRMAAWVRSTVTAEETVTAAETGRTRTRFAPRRQRSWARVLAWSVGLHVVVLGVLALVMGGADERGRAGSGAHVALEGEREWDVPVVDPAGVQLAYDFERINWDDVGAVRDRLALGESESLQDELRPDLLESLGDPQPMAWNGLSHPVGVVVAMSRRTNSVLKRRRLDLLGFNASGTLKAVDRGLRYLGRQQRKDGSFGADARGRVEQTALTLLAFLGDGNTSRGHEERDRTVARGIRWLRGKLFEAPLRGQPVKIAAAGKLGMATVALCEDYMLSFGDLPPKAAERRAEEIAVLAEHARGQLGGKARQGPRGELGGRHERTWTVWALDATARTGVVTASGADQHHFRAWVEATAAATNVTSDVPPGTMQALRAGTALMFSERGAEKPRFLSWSRTRAEGLVDRLDPTGRARSASPDYVVGDTALILLALQVAYRTY